MSNTNDYIITTMSGGITQRTFKTTYSIPAQADVEKSTQAPFQISFPGVPAIRGAWKPYQVVGGGDPPSVTPIPDSSVIEPILGDNLYHWWKFDDGGGTGTDAANSGVSPNAGGTGGGGGTFVHNAVDDVSLGNRNSKINCINTSGEAATSFTRQLVTQGGGGNPYTDFGSEMYLASGSLDQFTVSGWFKVTASLPSAFGMLWGFSRNENVDDGAGMYYDPSSPSEGLHFFCGGTGAAYQRVSSVGAPNVGEWFHIACVLDVTGSIHKAYLNGTAGANYSASAVLPPQKLDSSPITYINIGALGATHVNSPFHYFPVQASDFRWYNVALTDAQIQEIVEGDWP